MLGRRGVLADWATAIRGTLAMRRERGRPRLGMVVGGVVLTLAFLGLFVIGIRAEITGGGGHDEDTAIGAQSDIPGLAGAGGSSSTTGDGTTTDTGDPAGSDSSGGTTSPGAGTSSTGVLGSDAEGPGSQGETPSGGGSGGTTVITTTTTTLAPSTTAPPGSSTSTTVPPADPGVVGGLLDILGLG